MKTLHTAYRVTDLAVSLNFYSALGYEEVGRSLSDGATLAMLEFPGEEVVALELVHRLTDGPVQIGIGFSPSVVQVDGLAATIAAISRCGLHTEPEHRFAGPDAPRTSSPTQTATGSNWCSGRRDTPTGSASPTSSDTRIT
jgi:lactoylglutathione lyase